MASILWDSARPPVDEILSILDKNKNHRNPGEWQAGKELNDLMDSLKKVIEREDRSLNVSFRVIIYRPLLTAQADTCYHWHLAEGKGRTVGDPGQNVMVIALRGTSAVKLRADKESRDILAPCTYWSFTGSLILIPREPGGAHILVITMKDETETKQAS